MKLTSSLTSTRPVCGLLPLYDQACAEIDPVLRSLASQYTSTESFASNFFTRALTAVIDTFAGLAATFVTNLTKFNKSLKRSELREFVQSNRTKTFAVTNQLRVIKEEGTVYVPAGMKVTYLEAIETLALIYVQLNAMEAARTMTASLQEIFANITNGSTAASSAISSASAFIGQIVKAAKPSIEKCQKEFSGNSGEMVNWRFAYTNIADIKKSIDALLALEGRLQDVNKLTDEVAKIENMLKSIVNQVKQAGMSEVPVTARDVMNLGETAKACALVFDSYALAATRQASLEHNTVLNINGLFKNMS